MKKTVFKKSVSVLTIALLSLLAVSFLFCSCGSREQNKKDGGYRVKTNEIASLDGYQSVVRGVWRNNDAYCVQIRYDGDVKHFSKLYYFNKEGKLINTVDTKADYWVRFVRDNKIYAQYGQSEIAILNYDDASLISTVKVGDDVMTATRTDEGYIVYGVNNIIKYDPDNNVIASIPINGTDVFGKVSYIKSGDKEYISDDEGNYYTLDFDNKDLKLYRSGNDIGIGYDECYGQFVLRQSGMYRLDINNCELSQIFDWCDIDIKPNSKMTKNNISYYVFDEDNLAAIYDYSDNSAEVMFISYDEEYRDDRERLVIGGFRTREDINLKWAVYDYNQAQDKYRAVIEDYSEQFGSTSGYDAEKQNLALTKYWNDGHTPDMFCGMDFDYQSWGRSGIVKDINPLIEQYAPGLLNDVTPNIRDAMSSGDKCYSIVTSYTLEGCFGKASYFGNNDDVTIYDLAALKQRNNKHMYDSMITYDVLDSILERVINSRRCNTGDGSVFNETTMKDIVRFSIDNGQLIADFFVFYQSGDYLFRSTDIGDLYYFASMCKDDFDSEKVRFYGDPSVFGSVHMAQPTGITAISSSTDKDEECMKLIAYMLDDKVQECAVINGSIPVNDKILDRICEYAADPDKIPDDSAYKSFSESRKTLSTDSTGRVAVPANVIEDYRNAIEQVDAIRTFDWGVFNILYEEIASYEYQDKSVDDVAKAINSRLEVYLNENYGGAV